MTISLDNIGKYFNRQIVFRKVNLQFEAPHTYALLGANGSGKSTLLRILAGMQTPSTGSLKYVHHNTPLPPEHVFRHIAFVAPGMELIEELSLQEFFQFHFSFLHPRAGLRIDDILQIIGLASVADKWLSDFSSGMKQRVKLAQALFSDRDVLLLDEPCTNLDEAGIAQYHEWIKTYRDDRLTIVASNDRAEYSFCEHHIHMRDLM